MSPLQRLVSGASCELHSNRLASARMRRSMLRKLRQRRPAQCLNSIFDVSIGISPWVAATSGDVTISGRY